MQLFNQMNARKLEEEINVFSGIFRSPLFILVVIITFVTQMTMVENGGRVMETYPLNKDLNIICILIGSFELIWGMIIKQLPVRFFQLWALDEKPADGEAQSISSVLKRSSTINIRKSSNAAK